MRSPAAPGCQLPGVPLGLVEQGGDVLVVECVHALAPAPFGDHEAVVAEQPQLM